MTTIAWDGKCLAADRQATTNQGMKRLVHKFYEGSEKVFAGCGPIENNQKIARWLLGGDTKPTFTGDDDAAGQNGLVVFRTGEVWQVEGKSCELIPIEPGPYAVGSGCAYAMTAMHCGHSAAEAVYIASRFDAWTGAEVDVLEPCGAQLAAEQNPTHKWIAEHNAMVLAEAVRLIRLWSCSGGGPPPITASQAFLAKFLESK
jgi:hypothetical protein